MALDLIKAISPIFVVALCWILAFFVMSRLGWIHFARKYPVAQRPPGPAFDALSFVIGRVSTRYGGGAIRVVPCEAGLYFYALFYYRVGHRPFQVPWSSVSRMAGGRPFFRKMFFISIEDSAGKIWVSMPAKAEKAVLPFHPGPVEVVDSLLI